MSFVGIIIFQILLFQGHVTCQIDPYKGLILIRQILFIIIIIITIIIIIIQLYVLVTLKKKSF